MSDRRAPSRLTSSLFVAASCAFLVLAAYSVWFDRSATAAVAGALSFAFLLLLQLPHLESMEVLTLKVKLRERLSDAERLTDQLRTTASVSAQLMYVQLAFMNRMGSIPWARKRSLLAEVDQSLSQLNVSSDDIREYKRPFLNIVSFDLYLVFKGALDEILRRHVDEVNEKINELAQGGAIPADSWTYQTLLDERGKYSPEQHDFHDVLADPRLERLRDTVQGVIDRYGLTGHERSSLEAIRDEVSTLSESSWVAGTINPATEAYLNKYQHKNIRLKEIEAAAKS